MPVRFASATAAKKALGAKGVAQLELMDGTTPITRTPKAEKAAAKKQRAELKVQGVSKKVDYADLWRNLVRLHAKDMAELALNEFRFAEKHQDTRPWFHQRQFRFDWALPRDIHNPWSGGLAVEIDGGNWKAGGGRHGQDEDRVKMHLAILLGWTVIRFSPRQIQRDTLPSIAMVREIAQNLGLLP
jgi:hypothetical protein